MEEFEEGIIDGILLIKAMIRKIKQSKGTQEEDFKEVSLYSSLPTRAMVLTRKSYLKNQTPL